MKTSAACVFLLSCWSTTSLAATCDEIKAGIEARIRSAGVVQFTVKVVDADAIVPGKPVGTCARGTKKLVYVPGAASAASSAVITECKDGSVSKDGTCKK